MSLLVIVQARDGGTRLPGKIRAPLTDGNSVLAHVVSRASQLGPTHVAFPRPEEDESDVLSRFARVAREHPEVDTFVRVTADCPLLDVGVGAYVINTYRSRQNDVDFVGTTPECDGLDVEVFSRTALRIADLNARGRRNREHVTLWMRKNLGAMLLNVVPEPIRWSVDDATGLEFVRSVYSGCSHCARGVPHHTNASHSIGGGDRTLVVDLHHLEDGSLGECTAADILKTRMGGKVYESH